MTVNVPLNSVPTPATTTVLPTLNPCVSAVVNVATFDEITLFVTTSLLRRISVAPPPPPPTPTRKPVPPPFQPPTFCVELSEPPPLPPTYRYNTSPGVTGIAPCARPPAPPIPVAPLPPPAPCASNCNQDTPDGTVKVCTPPVASNVVSLVKIGVAYRCVDEPDSHAVLQVCAASVYSAEIS